MSKLIYHKKDSMKSSDKYPKKQEIVDRMEEINITKYLNSVQMWKEKHYSGLWKKKTKKEKIVALEALAYLVYYQQSNPAKLKPLYLKTSGRYALHVKTNTILLDKEKPSILSTLHEAGHAIHGTSETEACAFSVKIFAKTFPKEYSRLEWRGHMLKLPSKQH